MCVETVEFFFVSKKFGINDHILRPKKLSSNTASKVKVYKHALKIVEKKVYKLNNKQA